jgi:pseudouridine-5'-phosphate glycosidase
VIRIADEVRETLAAGGPVVALETTILAHGFPAPDGVEVGLACDAAVRESGAVPATIGVLDGEAVIGLTSDELTRFDASARKIGPRDVAACVVQRAVGATTVGGTVALAAAAGISFMATGGLGGVHRGYPFPPDVSADLPALAAARMCVVSAGVKSLLDVPATAELLETLGVPVVGFGTATIPLFYTALGGPPVSAQVDAVDEAGEIVLAHFELGRGGILVVRPPDESLDDVEPLIATALDEADAQGVHGQRVTPFVLARLHERSEGRTLRANRELAVANARLAGDLAAAAARHIARSLDAAARCRGAVPPKES